ncbi:MAG: non-ribosomal peptide synthetase, partial [Acidobacteria bacterium]
LDPDPSLWERIVQQLLVHHDALRLRFIATDGGWQQVITGSDETGLFTRADFSALSEASLRPAIEAAASELQASLNLSEGPLLRAALFDCGTQRPARLLLIIHHLAIDIISWRILLEDLQTAWSQLSQGEPVQLPPKTTSFKYWAHRFTEHTRSGGFNEELAYWLAAPRRGVCRLPVDYPASNGANTEASAQSVSATLSVEETRALLQDVPQTYNTQINDALLTALVQAFAQWTGERTLLVDLEGLGREAILEDVDLSRTVGWFTPLYPVRLELEDASQPGEALKSIKEQLRRIPNRGIGYGALRYLSGDAETAEKLRTLPQAEVSFVYLGQSDTLFSESAWLGPACESSGPTQSQRGQRSHLLSINGAVAEGCLRLNWVYSKHRYREDTIEKLAEGFMEGLRTLIAHCQSRDARSWTPSDVEEFNWSQSDIDSIAGAIDKSLGNV